MQCDFSAYGWKSAIAANLERKMFLKMLMYNVYTLLFRQFYVQPCLALANLQIIFIGT